MATSSSAPCASKTSHIELQRTCRKAVLFWRYCQHLGNSLLISRVQLASFLECSCLVPSCEVRLVRHTLSSSIFYSADSPKAEKDVSHRRVRQLTTVFSISTLQCRLHSISTPSRSHYNPIALSHTFYVQLRKAISFPVREAFPPSIKSRPISFSRL
jgi:hypothetical protein